MPAARALAGPACCPSGLSGPLDSGSAVELARLLKAVADPTRLRILAFLRSQPECSACVCDLTAAVGLSQPTVSHHLRILTDAGLLDHVKRGYWTWYSLRVTPLKD